MRENDLSTISDIVLISNVKNLSDSESYNELSARHSGLFYKVCHRYIKILSSIGVKERDVFEEKDAVLYKAILNYNPDHLSKTKFSTFLGNCARYFCLHKIEKANQMPELDDEDAINHEFESRSLKEYQEKSPKINFNGILNKLTKVPDKRIPNIFRLRYDPGLSRKKTWQSIANELELKISTVQALHKKGIGLLREEIKKDNVEVFC